MTVEFLTYGALGARLNISAEAARSLAKRLRLPRSLSEDGKALVSVDFAEIHHTPQPPGRRHAGHVGLLTAQITALQAEVAWLEASSASHRADFERERERAERLVAELLQATAEATAARPATPRNGRPGSRPSRRQSCSSKPWPPVTAPISSTNASAPIG